MPNYKMCFKKLFSKEDPIMPTKDEALLFAINNYPGSANDLRGCINDQVNITENLLKKYYPEFKIHTYKDRQVTGQKFLSELSRYIHALQAGDRLFIHYSGHGTQGADPYHTEADGYSEALYLYDGTLWDYQIAEVLAFIPPGALVIMAFDSCHAGGSVTRKRNYLKNRYVQTQDINPAIGRRKSAIRETTQHRNFIFFAGCQESQYSADAFIEGDYNGAFTWAWVKTFSRFMTYRQWCDSAVKILENYEQIPIVIGSELNRTVFN
jgi:metacaspase-1